MSTEERGASGHLSSYRQSSRQTGWSCPPHPLQMLAWTSTFIFVLIYFTTIVPGMLGNWKWPGYIIEGIVCFIHMLCHLVATTINPIDPAVQGKNSQVAESSQMPEFDRSRHKHVIENQYCYLCEVKVGSKSKHCSACNKCVAKFDHHCKWLNNCVGGRNYKWFLGTLLSGTVASLILAVVCTVQFIAYYRDHKSGSVLQQYADYLMRKSAIDGTVDVNMTTSLSSLPSIQPVFYIIYQMVADEVWIAVISLTGLAALLSCVLLMHLFTFHMYLTLHDMSTYDYIVKRRQEDNTEGIQSSDKDHAHPTMTADRIIQPVRGRKKKNRIVPSSNNKTSIHQGENLQMHMYNNSAQHAKQDDNANFVAYASSDNRDGDDDDDDDERGGMDDYTLASLSPEHKHSSDTLHVQTSFVQTALPRIVTKKVKKKKKKRHKFMQQAIPEGTVSTIGSSDFYAHSMPKPLPVRVPMDPIRIEAKVAIEITAPSFVNDFESDSGDSLKELTLDRNRLGGGSLESRWSTESISSMCSNRGLRYAKSVSNKEQKRSNSIGSAHQLSNRSTGKNRILKSNSFTVPNRNDEHNTNSASIDLNTTTMFIVNSSAKFKSDGSLDYMDRFAKLPLTPIPKHRPLEVPPLDLAGLRSSTDSAISSQKPSTNSALSDTYKTLDMTYRLGEVREV